MEEIGTKINHNEIFVYSVETLSFFEYLGYFKIGDKMFYKKI